MQHHGTAHCQWTRKFLQTSNCYCASLHIQRSKPSFSAKQDECGVNISTYTPKGISSEHSVLLHDQHPGVCEEQSCYMNADEAIVLHFMAITITSICCWSCTKGFLGNVSNVAPISSCISSVNMSHLHVLLRSKLECTARILTDCFPVWNTTCSNCIYHIYCTEIHTVTADVTEISQYA